MAAKPRARGGGAAVDGRALRGARNHEAIVDAMYALVKDTHEPPTVEAVAERAGVGARTVFRQFEDLDTLFRTMAERVQREVLARFATAAPSGDLHADLRALIARRAGIFEHITPFRRASLHLRRRSAFLRERDAALARMFRGALEAVLAPHAASVPAPALDALDALLSFEVWERLRDTQKLSAKRAEEVLVEAALRLAGP